MYFVYRLNRRHNNNIIGTVYYIYDSFYAVNTNGKKKLYQIKYDVIMY